MRNSTISRFRFYHPEGLYHLKDAKKKKKKKIVSLHVLILLIKYQDCDATQIPPTSF